MEVITSLASQGERSKLERWVEKGERDGRAELLGYERAGL